MTVTSVYYEGKVAVVTGAASGIGLALAETMLSYGASKIVLADFNRENLERETARLEKAYPGKTLGIHCDVTKETDVQAMIARAASFGGERIDLLFNNAGAGFGGEFDKSRTRTGRRPSRSTSTARSMASARCFRSCASRAAGTSSTPSPALHSCRCLSRQCTALRRRR